MCFPHSLQLQPSRPKVSFQHGALQTVGEEERRSLPQLSPQHGRSPLPLLQGGLLQRPVKAHLTQKSLQRYRALFVFSFVSDRGSDWSISLKSPSAFIRRILNIQANVNIMMCAAFFKSGFYIKAGTRGFVVFTFLSLSHPHLPLSAKMSWGSFGIVEVATVVVVWAGRAGCSLVDAELFGLVGAGVRGWQDKKNKQGWGVKWSSVRVKD